MVREAAREVVNHVVRGGGVHTPQQRRTGKQPALFVNTTGS
jgi:hypothetical protein